MRGNPDGTPFNVEEEAFNFASTFSGEALLASAILPAPKGSIGMLMSRSGATRLFDAGIKNPHEAFVAAVTLKAQNKTPDEIYAQTGWEYNDFIKDWEYTLSFDNVKLNTDAILKKFDAQPPGSSTPVKVQLTDILDYPDLYIAYPGLKDITVDWSPTGNRGGADFLRDNITIRTGSTTSSSFGGVLEHELQHFIQVYEGHPTGSSPLQVTVYNPQTKKSDVLDIPATLKGLAEDRAGVQGELDMIAWVDKLPPEIKADTQEATLRFLQRRLGRQDISVDEYYLELDNLPKNTVNLLNRTLSSHAFSRNQLELLNKIRIAILDQQIDLFTKTDVLSERAADAVFFKTYELTYGEVEARLAEYDYMMAKTKRGQDYINRTTPEKRRLAMLQMEHLDPKQVNFANLTNSSADNTARIYMDTIRRGEQSDDLLIEATKALLRSRQRGASAQPSSMKTGGGF
jgi:hypothetical protein